MAENPAISPATIEAMRRNFGLDRPWYIQYGLYLENILLHFDFGESFSRHQPVFTVIREGLGNTLLLAGAAAVVTWGLALPLGIWAAVRQYSWVDKTLSLLAFVWLSVPEILSGSAAADARRSHRMVSRGRHALASTTTTLRPLARRGTCCGTWRCPRSSSASCRSPAACGRCAATCWTSCASTT